MTILTSPSERISDELANFIGPNHVDFVPVSVMVTEYVHRFGTVNLGDIPEDKWNAFLLWATVPQDQD